MNLIIEITQADRIKQTALIHGLSYEFNFSEMELAKAIRNNNTISELEDISGLDSADYTALEMSEQIAQDWDHEDVALLIADFVVDHSDKLIDHLTPNYN